MFTVIVDFMFSLFSTATTVDMYRARATIVCLRFRNKSYFPWKMATSIRLIDGDEQKEAEKKEICAMYSYLSVFMT